MDVHWIKETINKENVELFYRPGRDLIADGLTKILPRELLQQFRRRAALVSRGATDRPQ